MTETPMALYDAYGAVAVTEAARRAGLVELLDRQPVSATEAASQLALEPRATRAVLDALVALDVAEVDDTGRYRGTAYTGVLEVLQCWEGLEQTLRDGKPAVRCDETEGAETAYPRVTGLMDRISREAADAVADHLAQLGRGLRVLEVGAGAASWSLGLCRRDAGCRVTALDLPKVVVATREHVTAHGFVHAYEFVGADMFAHDYPARAYELVLVPNVCHLFGPAQNAALLARLAGAVEPGGTMAIIDVTPGDLADRAQALYILSLLIRTERGAVHSAEAYAEWVAAAGFGELSRVQLTGRFRFSLMTATRL